MTLSPFTYNSMFAPMYGSLMRPVAPPINSEPTTSAPTAIAANLNPTQDKLTLSTAPLTQWNAAGSIVQTPQDRTILSQAMACLGRIVNDRQDEAYLQSMGVYPPFRSGANALKLIQERKIS